MTAVLSTNICHASFSLLTTSDSVTHLLSHKKKKKFLTKQSSKLTSSGFCMWHLWTCRYLTICIENLRTRKLLLLTSTTKDFVMQFPGWNPPCGFWKPVMHFSLAVTITWATVLRICPLSAIVLGKLNAMLKSVTPNGLFLSRQTSKAPHSPECRGHDLLYQHISPYLHISEFCTLNMIDR